MRSGLLVHLGHLGEDPLRVLAMRGKGEVAGDAGSLGHHLLLDVEARLAELLVDLLLGRRGAQRKQNGLLHAAVRGRMTRAGRGWRRTWRTKR